MLNYKIFKRFIDILFSGLILFFLSPLLFLTFIIILLIDKVNPIFTQTRSGLNKKNFFIYKFNSMKLIDGRLKITNLGKFIRKFKIDELPQLVNILKNDMSLIGPRPLYSDFNLYYKKKHEDRFLVKPGITGYAQINLINSSHWDQKFDLDVYYVNNLSFIFDIKIFLKTIFVIYLSIINKRKIIESTNYKDSFFKTYVKEIK